MARNQLLAIMAQITSAGVWMGTPESLNALFSSVVHGGLEPKMQMEMNSHYEDDNDPPRFGGQYHYMMNQYYDVAVIDIRGALTPYESPYNRYFGVVSYEEVRNAVATAVKDESVSTILLKVDSPGGSVKGVDECCEFLQKVNKEHMPIYTYASGQMASAGYFLGSVGKKIFTTKLSTVGSIGSIVPIMSQFRMLEKAGIDVAMIRSPEFKALGHPLDPLTEKAQEEAQNLINTMTEVFEQFVAENRGTSVEVVRAKYGQGRSFVGQTAVNNGLADEIATFDSVIRRLRSTGNNNFI